MKPGDLVAERAARSKQRQAARYAANSEEIKARMRAYYAEHREERRAYGIAYRERNRDVVKERKAAYYVANREKEHARSVARYAVNREQDKKRSAAWRAANPERRRADHLGRYYGLALEEFDALLASQGGRCAICRTEEWGKRRPHVDHDHASGKIRGILCHRCNTALGFVKDDQVILSAAVNYLKDHAGA